MICKVRQQFISKPNTPRAQSGPVRIFGWPGDIGGTGVTRFDPMQSKNVMHPAGCGGFLVQNATLDGQGSIYPTFFDDFEKYEKSMILGCRPERQKVD